MRGPAATSTLFPYTTLFRSNPAKGEFTRQTWTSCPLHCIVDTSITSAFSASHFLALRNLRSNPSGLSYFTKVQNRSEEHTSELQSHSDLVCRLLLEKKNKWI